jgi:predicted Zn-dependent peptidase
LPAINKALLDNQMPLYWLNAGVQEVVEINWVFEAGLWYEQKPAVAQAVASLLKNGTSRHTAQQINEALEFYGADLKVGAGNDFTTVTLHCLTKHLSALLPVVYEVTTDAVFPEDEVQLYKQNAVQRLLVNLRQCDFVANQQIDALLFGEEHPYGRFSKKEKIEAIKREDLIAFYAAHYNLADVKIFMGGKCGDAEVALINETFGKTPLEKKDTEEQVFSAPARSGRVHRTDNDPNGVQGAVRIGRLFPNRHDPDYSPMVVLNALFGGYFGSRLMRNIREDKGYTYGIHSLVTPYLHGGSLVVSTEAGRDVAEAAVKEVYREMEALCNEPAPEEELLLVKNYLLGSLLADLDGPFSILYRWRTLILNGFTEDYFNNNVRIYKTVNAKELQTLAQKYYKPDEFYEVIVV